MMKNIANELSKSESKNYRKFDMDKALIIFVRNPELGKVKTRLATEIGDENALAIYIKLLDHTEAVAAAADCDKFIFATEKTAADKWHGFQQKLQSSGDLGEKILNAFVITFSKGYTKNLIIGSDCPELTTAHINDAFNKLETHDLVIGPATDGGYYLLGLKTFHPELFQLAAWSTDTVFTETIAIAEQLSLKYSVLEKLNDVDELKDLPLEWKREFAL